MKTHFKYYTLLIIIVITAITPTISGASYLKVVRAINCGGDAAGYFEADNSYSGGGIYETTATITPGYAPQEVLRTERNATPSLTYTINGLYPGSEFTVWLYFAEIYWDSAVRVFNIDVNGSKLLNFDIFTEAGGKNKCIRKPFVVNSDSSGTITISMTYIPGKDRPKISGIEIFERTVEFNDSNLEVMVENALGIDDPTPTEMLDLTVLAPGGGPDVVDLTGIEYADNLEELHLWFCLSISDISPLSGLTNLRELGLQSNNISDITPLSGLTNMERLILQLNEISDISPLSGMTKLTELDLSDNLISNISPLAGMTKLTKLYLSNNLISNISPLAKLTNLETLHLYSNQISDVSPLAGLTNLEALKLEYNQISDLSPLSGLTNMKYLLMNDNLIDDVSPLAGLTDLEILDLDQNQINNLAPLSGLTNLFSLSLSSNHITDISQLPNLTELSSIYLKDNNICDISALTGMTGLHKLDLRGNPLKTDACNIYIPQIIENNPWIEIYYDECITIYRALSISSTTGGSVITPGEGDFWYSQCTVVQVSATTDSGYEFVSWTGTAVDAGTVTDPLSSSTSVTMSSNYTLQANFAPRRTLTISSSNGGSVTIPGEGTFGPYSHGALVNLMATPQTGYHFESWTGTSVDADKVANPNAASTTVTMDDDFTLIANFELDIIIPPEVMTGIASNIKGASVMLHGTLIDDGNEPSQCRFMYWMDGEEPQYTSWTGYLPGGSSFHAEVMNLEVDSLYHYVAQAQNSAGITEGEEEEFQTLIMVQLTITSTAGGSIIYPDEGLNIYNWSNRYVMICAFPIDPNLFYFANWTGTAVDAGKVEDPNSYLSRVFMDSDYTLKANFVTDMNMIYVDDDALYDPAPYNFDISDPNENGTLEHPFDMIQEGIDVALDGATVIVREGIYQENIEFMGRNIYVTSFDSNSTEITNYPVIDANYLGTPITFYRQEDSNCVLEGFVITRGLDEWAGGILCENSSPAISHCVIVGNRAIPADDIYDSNTKVGAVYLADSNAMFVNCSLNGNYSEPNGAAFCLFDSNAVLINCILWDNQPQEILLHGDSDPNITYTDIMGSWPDMTDFDIDPYFFNPGYWAHIDFSELVFEPNDPNAVWIDGDYHLLSEEGRWDPNSLSWIVDEFTSLCIDAGDPNSSVTDEPYPHGEIINMGAYGGTNQASMTPLEDIE